MRQTRDFQQVADFRLSRAVEYRRGEGNAFAEAFGVLQQLIVAELASVFHTVVSENTSRNQAAHRFGANFLAQQTLEAVAEFLGGPAEVRLQNLPNVHT